MIPNQLLLDAQQIWHVGVNRVRPEELLRTYLASHIERLKEIKRAPRIVVVGGGKASGAMAAAFESLLVEDLDRVSGIINVPDSAVRPLQKIRLHSARPAASNHPTSAGVIGVSQMLEEIQSCEGDDIAVVLLSGGGSALLPAPVEGITLEDKQQVTQLLHACGATIQEMNCVRKHLSKFKGGGLARNFRGKRLISLILSDVIGDPLDVIASGPTAIDPTRFEDSLAVLQRYSLLDESPPAVVSYLQRGIRGEVPETLKELPENVENLLVGSNRIALLASATQAETLGYRVLNLGTFIDGETREVGSVLSGMVRSIQQEDLPVAPPCCLLVGGETTVKIGPTSGKGGRNQEFVLSMLNRLGRDGMKNVVLLSGGTDGEDGPTDSAGALADEAIFDRTTPKEILDHLMRHDAYPLFERTGNLLKTGLTETNVMDVRVILVGR